MKSRSAELDEMLYEAREWLYGILKRHCLEDMIGTIENIVQLENERHDLEKHI